MNPLNNEPLHKKLYMTNLQTLLNFYFRLSEMEQKNLITNFVDDEEISREPLPNQATDNHQEVPLQQKSEQLGIEI